MENIQQFTLEFMKGFKTSINIYEGGKPKMLIDCCCRIIRGYNLWEEIQYYLKEGMHMNEILDKFVIGRSFLTTYGNQRIYRIDELAEDGLTLESKFPNDKFRNFADYYQK